MTKHQMETTPLAPVRETPMLVESDTFYVPGTLKPGTGILDSNGTSYVVEEDNSLRRVGPKVRKTS